ncbi:FAD-binding oxidoreductase [Microtetraspora malaysiensis]|uniref:FAD-binding oxidoreductase n=1 Tax=Microtetraspora malaysiensis TaxID=161358 RepID=UPI003D911A3F
MSRQSPYPGVSRRAVDQLIIQVKGDVFLPGDPGYEAELSGFNQIVRHRPAVVVAATCAEDVAAAVSFARDQGLAVGVQATGHGSVAPAERAVMISTRWMHTVSVDPEARTAQVEAGALWHQVIAAAAFHGLAPLNGSSPQVGVVGYTLGGGLGPLGRQYGYAADHVTRIQIVTADGIHRTVTPERDSDLFWAVRGGKGNFGIVTALEFRLMPVRRLYGGGIYFPGERAASLIRAWWEWAGAVPESMTSSLALLRLPDAPTVPAYLRDRLTVHLRIAFTGPADEGERLVRPLRAVGAALADTVGDMPYSAVAEIHQDPTEPQPYHERNIVLREFDDEAIDALLAAAGPGSACADPMVELRHLGGALSRPPVLPNAVGNRDGALTLSTLSRPGSADCVLGPLARWSTGRRYLNFLAGPDTAYAVADCCDQDTYARLRQVKEQTDPLNLFRLGHALRPDSSTEGRA